jgi:hypothetical protein
VLAVDLDELEEVRAVCLFELGDVEAHVLEGDGALIHGVGHRPGLGQQRDVEGAALGTDLEVLLEAARLLEHGLVLDFGVDQLVDDALNRFVLLRLHRVQHIDGAGVLAAATVLGVGCAAVVVIVVAARGEQHHDDGGHRHQSPESHRVSPLVAVVTAGLQT